MCVCVLLDRVELWLINSFAYCFDLNERLGRSMSLLNMLHSFTIYFMYVVRTQSASAEDTNPNTAVIYVPGIYVRALCVDEVRYRLQNMV